MKNNIHPNYHEAVFTCSCGNSFASKTTAAGNEVKIDVCNKCHPFYTGTKGKILDNAGRVEKFNRKIGK